jgi:predicted helicase
MKFAKKGDKTTVIYNGKITIKDIPDAAWEYVVNGKAALDWVMERQREKTDKESGIINDANDWAIETMGNPKYPLELFQRVVTVSLETQKLVAALPKLEISNHIPIYPIPKPTPKDVTEDHKDGQNFTE